MSTFASYYSPIEQSVKPKSYFESTQELMKARIMNSGVSIKAKSPKFESKKPTIMSNPYFKELAIVLPWVIAGCTLILSVF
jgi:hypothetical protein